MKLLTLPFAAALLSACASTAAPECRSDADYLYAESVRPVASNSELTVAQAPEALLIPDVNASAIKPNAQTTNRRTACLDFPPALAQEPAKP